MPPPPLAHRRELKVNKFIAGIRVLVLVESFTDGYTVPDCKGGGPVADAPLPAKEVGGVGSDFRAVGGSGAGVVGSGSGSGRGGRRSGVHHAHRAEKTRNRKKGQRRKEEGRRRKKRFGQKKQVEEASLRTPLSAHILSIYKDPQNIQNRQLTLLPLFPPP